jgi:hypothetical protein
MQKIVNFELSFGKQHFFATVFILQPDEFVLKLDSLLTFVVQIHLKAILGLSELLTLVLEHKLDFTQSSPMLFDSI